MKKPFSAAITGISHYLPEQRLTNADLEKMVETNDEWIRSRTGIAERRILEDGKGTSYLVNKAMDILLEQKSLDPKDIDLIILATITPDMIFPATACLVQEYLGAKNA